jgi:hypothetical protein
MPAPADWSLGASEAPALLEGDLPGLWSKITGRTARYDDGDYGETLAAKIRAKAPLAKVDPLNLEIARRMGHVLEPLHAAWFEERTGLRVENQQRRVRRDDYPLHATLDGLVKVLGWQVQLRLDHALVPWEAKAVSPHSKLPEVIERYQAQLQAQMLATDSPCAVFSVLWRTPKWQAVVVDADPVLQAEVLDRLELLAFHIEDDSEPRALPPFPVSSGTWRPLAASAATVQPASVE